jgi:hypothetical protein
MAATSEISAQPGAPPASPRSCGAGCGCKLAPGALLPLLRLPARAMTSGLVGSHTSDDAGAAYRLAEDLALVQTVASLPRPSMTRSTSGASRRPTPSRTCTRWAHAL